MTTTEDNNSTSIGRRLNSDAISEGYRWTCPFCGKSRTNTSTGEAGKSNAVAALRTHIIASDGADHGPKNEYPADADQHTLSEHVTRVEGR